MEKTKLLNRIVNKMNKKGGADLVSALVNKPLTSGEKTSNQKSLNVLNLAVVAADEDFENTVYDLIYALFLIKPKQKELERINGNLLLRKYQNILENNVKLFVDIFKYGDLLNEQMQIETYNNLNAYIQQNISLRLKTNNSNTSGNSNTTKPIKMKLIVNYFLYYQTPLETRQDSSQFIKNPFDHYKNLLKSLKMKLDKETYVSIIRQIVGTQEGNNSPSSLAVLLNTSPEGYQNKVDYLMRKIMEWPTEEEIPDINNNLNKFKRSYVNNIPEELASKLASVFDEYQQYWQDKISKLLRNKSQYNNNPNTRTRENVYKSRNYATLQKEYEELSNLRLTNKQIYDSLTGNLKLTDEQRKSVRNKMVPKMQLVKQLTQDKKKRMLETLGFPKLIVKPNKNLIADKYKEKTKELQEAYVYLMSILREGNENITPPLEHYYETGKVNITNQNYAKPQNLNNQLKIKKNQNNKNNSNIGNKTRNLFKGNNNNNGNNNKGPNQGNNKYPTQLNPNAPNFIPRKTILNPQAPEFHVGNVGFGRVNNSVRRGTEQIGKKANTGNGTLSIEKKKTLPIPPPQ